tara:strand:- start:155 stop:523 length:369 start_codon:yes stop_codon:yes gene_type:complete
MGMLALFSNYEHVQVADSSVDIYTFFSAFRMGFITNVFNPKATLFFLSLYTLILNSNPSIYIQLAYGIWMSIATALWFSLLSIVLTDHRIANMFENFGFKIQKIMGFLLVWIGIKILLEIFF